MSNKLTTGLKTYNMKMMTENIFSEVLLYIALISLTRMVYTGLHFVIHPLLFINI